MLILEIALGIVLATIILAFLPFIVRAILVLLGIAVVVAFWLWASSDPSDAGTVITIIFAFCALIYCGGLWEARRRRIERQSLHPTR